MTDPQPIRPWKPGATLLPDGRFQFVVWAPHHESVRLCLEGGNPSDRPMLRDELGYHHLIRDDVGHGSTYFYGLSNGQKRPDPASRFQPAGVHGPSQVVDLSGFVWSDAKWTGVPFEDSVFYELHTGTFTQEGTFSAVIPHLDALADLGVTTIELMPIAQFPGPRNWGYDGAYPFAIQSSYGTPAHLQKLVDAAHARNLAVALDVVYNHLGPEGNYLREYGGYFTEHYRTPWGAALNYDGPGSDEVRHFFIENALYWLEEFHIDVLRLDAVHSIYDGSAFSFLAELSNAVKGLSERAGREIHLVAESDLNDVKVLRPVNRGGFGMDGQWTDDFHHSVHTLLTGENTGYYADFGEVRHLARTLKQGWFYSGEYSKYRQRRFGNPPSGLKREHFVVCIQNHDQVGNRALGDRLAKLVNFESLKLAAGVTILSGFVPLLFMGEEYGEIAPFLYFTSHGDPELAEAVRRGRKEEFRAFGWQLELADPQAESTFLSSKLNHGLKKEEPHHTLHQFYKRLLTMRREHRLTHNTPMDVREYDATRVVIAFQERANDYLALIFHFGDAAATLSAPLPAGRWETALDSADLPWLGPGPSLPSRFDVTGTLRATLQPRSFTVLKRTNTLPE